MSAVDDFKHYVNVPDSHRLSVAWVKCLALDAIAELEAERGRPGGVIMISLVLPTPRKESDARQTVNSDP